MIIRMMYWLALTAFLQFKLIANKLDTMQFKSTLIIDNTHW